MKRWVLLYGCLLSLAFGVHASEALDQVVAEVNDGVITASELDQQVAQLRQQLVARQVSVPSEEVLRKQVLQHLIDVNLQLQLAKQQGIVIEDTELNEVIESIAARNHVTPAQMQQAVAEQGMTWSQYRENIQKELLLSRLQQQAVGREVNVPPSQVVTYLKQTQQARQASQQVYHVQNLVIPLPPSPTPRQLMQTQEKARALLKQATAGVAFSDLVQAESSGEMSLEWNDLGERHLAELPEIFEKIISGMKPGEVSGPIRTGNGFQLLKLLGSTGSQAQHLITKTHVRHILIKPSPGMTEAEMHAQLQHLYQQLRSGNTFDRLAKRYSLDALSAVKGGDLGWMGPGELVPEFEKAMDKLPLHTISEAIKTRYGWHFIEVLARKTVNDTEAYERAQVRQLLQQRQFTEAVQRWQQRLRARAFVHIINQELA